MLHYLVRRMLWIIPIWLGLSILVFCLFQIIPGDVTHVILGENATPESIAQLRHQLGLDRPLYVRYLSWLWGALHLDFGQSYFGNESVMAEIANRAGATINIALLSLIIANIVAIPAGVISAIKQNTWIDYLTRFISVSGFAMPTFWLGIIVTLLFLTIFKWSVPLIYVSPFTNPWLNFQKIILPVLCLAYVNAAVIARMARSCMLEVLREDYIRTARAKGLKERIVILKHALKNAIIPVVTVSGLYFAIMLGGTVILENVFNIAGMGRLLVSAIHRRDYPIIQAELLIIATGVLIGNLMVDIMYAWLDPRIRYK